MSLFSNFIVSRIVNALEEQFISHVPEMQQAFLNEVAKLVKVVTDWIESKMNPQGVSNDEEKNS